MLDRTASWFDRGRYPVNTARRVDLDQAKGLAILLVVFGHLVARADPIGVEWYEPLRQAIYSFHMPFFLYLSGLAAVEAGAVLQPPAAWARLFGRRARRLLLPFFALGLGIVVAKRLAGRIMFVDNPPSDLAAGIGALVWHTAASPAMSVWYLFVLFVVSCAAVPLMFIDRGRPRLLVLVGLLLYVLQLPAYVYADHVTRFAVFFALGVWAGTRHAVWNGFVDRAWRSLGLCFAIALVLIVRYGNTWPAEAELLPMGALSMPVLHGFVRNTPYNVAQLLLWLGRYSFMIYLFNTLFIGLAKGLLLRMTDWDAPHFFPFACVLMASGTFGPIALKHFVLRRSRILDRLTR